MKHIVVGLGEVGRAIKEIFNADGYDISVLDGDSIREAVNRLQGKKTPKATYEYLHICIPHSEEFIKSVKEYQKKYCPKFTIIHSTVPVGTSKKLGAIHSPIRGLHPHLKEGILTFVKFIGGRKASGVADEFRRHGIKVMLFDKAETTELGKLFDTEYYRACIEFTLRAKELSDKFKVPFHEAHTLFNLTYNEGYSALGHPEYVRPTLQPIMKPIGGHCVMPNKIILEALTKKPHRQ